LTFWTTKNGKVRRIPVTDAIAALLASRPRVHPWVFTNTRTGKPYTTIRKVFERALERAKITTGDVTVHTLRHTALSRMIEHGLDDYTVMSISGHSSTRMLERYTRSDASNAHRGAGHVQLVHKMSTKLGTAKRGSRSCLFC
jgi:integrase